jgi:hypothetical protein
MDPSMSGEAAEVLTVQIYFANPNADWLMRILTPLFYFRALVAKPRFSFRRNF